MLLTIMAITTNLYGIDSKWEDFENPNGETIFTYILFESIGDGDDVNMGITLPISKWIPEWIPYFNVNEDSIRIKLREIRPNHSLLTYQLPPSQRAQNNISTRHRSIMRTPQSSSNYQSQGRQTVTIKITLS